MSRYPTIADLRDLAGGAFTTIEPITVPVEAPWDRVLGGALHLLGGCEIKVRDDALSDALEADSDPTSTSPDTFLVPAFVVDRDYPRASILVPLRLLDAKLNPCEAGAGPRSKGDPTRCDHKVFEDHCAGCFFKRWRERAIEEGMIES